MDDKGIPYTIHTRGEKLVTDYTGLSMMDIQDLDLDIYYFLRREAYIFELSQTEKGREYLDDCWRIGQTKADRGALRAKFGRKEG